VPGGPGSSWPRTIPVATADPPEPSGRPSSANSHGKVCPQTDAALAFTLTLILTVRLDLF